jgi:Flp pilus assembly protein TadG
MERRPMTHGSQPAAGAKGQAMILIALTLVVLLAFVGLVTDVGQLLIFNGHLKRAVDAASLAAAGQFREGRDLDEMASAAVQVMTLNGIDNATVQVQTCENAPGDPNLCMDPPRKLVRVSGAVDVPTIFLHLVNAASVRVETSAIAEAASMDVVLAIDISDSMAYDGPIYDPAECNYLELDHDPASALDPTTVDPAGDCHPFNEVKAAAINFVTRILAPPEFDANDNRVEQDRIAIVTFANGWKTDSDGHFSQDEATWYRSGGWTFNREYAIRTINDLIVYQAAPRSKNDPGSDPDWGNCFEPSYNWDNLKPNDPINNKVGYSFGPCRAYTCNGESNTSCDPNDVQYYGMLCPSCTKDIRVWDPLPPWDPPPIYDKEWSALPTTNIGGGLLLSGNMFALETRPSALWVVVLLTDGAANTTFRKGDIYESSPDRINDYSTYPMGYCPNPWQDPFCIDWDVTTRHLKLSDGTYPSNYDAEDYARDMADFVGCPPQITNVTPTPDPDNTCVEVSGQGAVIFSIGLGQKVLDHNNEINGKPFGATLLRYISRVGYSSNSNPANDPCLTYDQAGDYTSWCGNYYYSPSGNQLVHVFEDIASRIFTRLVH